MSRPREVIDVDDDEEKPAPSKKTRTVYNLVSSDSEPDTSRGASSRSGGSLVPQRPQARPQTLKKTIENATRNNNLKRPASSVTLPPPIKRAKGDRHSSPITIDDDDDHPTLKIPVYAKNTITLSSDSPATTPMYTLNVDMTLDEEKPSVTDSEEEYSNIHAAYSLDAKANWKELDMHPQESSQMTDSSGLASAMSQVQITSSLSGKLIEALPDVSQHKEGNWLWNLTSKLKNRASLQKQDRYQYHKTAQNWGHKSITLYHELQYRSLTYVTSFRQAGGPINRISQSPKGIVISSGTCGGYADSAIIEQSSTADPLAQNREGTLQVWLNGKNHVLANHKAEVPSSHHPGLVQKHYTVNDVKFDPHSPYMFASAGNDYIVRLWSILPHDNSCVASVKRKISFPDAPGDLLYHKHNPSLAITCNDGHIYVYADPAKSSTHIQFPLTPPEVSHNAGAMVWGNDCTACYIFASSEPKAHSNECKGHHRVFDAEHSQMVCELDANESGDALAIDHTGQKLALFTHGPDDSNQLRIYDVKHKEVKPSVEISLEPFNFSHFPKQSDGEVTTASFSPDDMLLAVARNDNTLHVYDTRFLGRGPSSKFSHWGEWRHVGLDSWGVTEAVWVESWNRRGLGIVSGGMDGCVRLWDTRCSDEDLSNGQILAQADYDIGHFSLGDRYQGEKALVIGDNGATVAIYDWAADLENSAP